ncbi:hypothetical protein GJ698_25585 [Pseudoduganella sp. FT26W]|uniref:Aerotolerance regulator N-terminal domain-containing protein n=2 Tax=Duganella aquatilis TaxID=2666082 RepID=A0A844D307_9BURK|nr:hypothetical protein [Duganella aquatilis]
MLSSYPLWWLALPVLLLPIWWHRQKRQRLKAEPLATARFLPSAPPEQLRVWQWRDKLLLLVRCLLLVTLIAWLAATIFPWRGDTVLVDAGVDKAWAEKEIAAAGFASAARIDMPPAALSWLRQNERDWRVDARLLIIARAEKIAMSARLPQLSHQLELRTQNASLPLPPTATEQIVLPADTAHLPGWQALFAAFSSASPRYTIAAEPTAKTSLIIWDKPTAAPPANWRATNWWVAASASAAAAFPELANAATLTINGITLKYADSPRGRLWASDAFPSRDADTARALYEAWQLLAAAPAPAYATPSQTFAAARSALPPAAAKPANWLALALLALFILERTLTHARRN